MEHGYYWYVEQGKTPTVVRVDDDLIGLSSLYSGDRAVATAYCITAKGRNVLSGQTALKGKQ